MLILAGAAALVLAPASLALPAEDAQPLDKTEQQPAPEAEETTMMDNEKLAEVLKRIDTEVEGDAGHWQMTYDSLKVLVITDEKAGRMRFVSPITKADILEMDGLLHLMQANFDSALDALYAIASGWIWRAYIHPLPELTEKELFSGLDQTIALAVSFGTTFSSGTLVFQGSDSSQIMKGEAQRYYDEIQEKALGNTT